jgi:hypothetical protein
MSNLVYDASYSCRGTPFTYYSYLHALIVQASPGGLSTSPQYDQAVGIQNVQSVIRFSCYSSESY